MAVKPKRHHKTGESVPGCWIIDYWPTGRNGRRIRREFGSADDPKTEGEALSLEMELRRLARREPVSRINPRVFEILPDWKAEYRNHHEDSTVKDLETCMVHLVAFFGPLFLAEVVPSLIEQYKGQRLRAKTLKRLKDETDADYIARRETDGRPLSKRTINKELSYLSGFLKWAAEHGYCAPVRVKLFPAKQTRAAKARPLHPAEASALLEHLEPEYQLIFLLHNDAGLRRAEVLGGGKYHGLRAEDIDLKFGLIYVRGKGDKERIVPITTDRLRLALETRLKQIKTGHLSINPKTEKPWYSIRKALTRAAEAAGIEKRVYAHLLRHNFGTHAVAAGMNLRTVQEIMGHSTIKTTEIYTHMAPYLQTEAAKLQAFLTSTADKPAPSKPSPEAPPPERGEN